MSLKFLISSTGLLVWVVSCILMRFCILERTSAAYEEGVEGFLTRKQEWESTTKKASNRSWDKVSFFENIIGWLFEVTIDRFFESRITGRSRTASL